MKKHDVVKKPFKGRDKNRKGSKKVTEVKCAVNDCENEIGKGK